MVQALNTGQTELAQHRQEPRLRKNFLSVLERCWGVAKVAKGERSGWADGKGTQTYCTSKKQDAGTLIPWSLPVLCVSGGRDLRLLTLLRQLQSAGRSLWPLRLPQVLAFPGHSHLPPWC